MQLAEAVTQIATMPPDHVICAMVPFTWGSDAVIAKLTDDFRIPHEVKAAGYESVLGQEDVSMVLTHAARKRLSSRSVAELVCHYAVTDAWPAWFDDIPDVAS